MTDKKHVCTFKLADGNLCGKAFSYSSYLDRHMRIHTGDHPYACKTCGQAFSRSSNLTVHMRSHSGDRPYACTTCGMAFSQSGSLTKHMRTHSGDRPYVCTTCGKAFSQSNSLATHMRTHSGHRPYACTTCGKAFSTSSYLATHMRAHDKHIETHTALDAYFTTNGIAATAFGSTGLTRDKDITANVKRIMENQAGFANIMGEETQNKWNLEQGPMSLEGKLMEGDVAAYVLVTMQPITAGNEEKCPETHDFMTSIKRNPLWRIEREEYGDLKRFTCREFNSVRRSYLLATCFSAFDATCLEGGLQFYLEKVLGMPHGMCLHRKAGAGSRMENSFTPSELTRIKNNEIMVYSVAITLVKTTSQEWFIGPLDQDASRQLTSCTVSSHDGKTSYNVVVRGSTEEFPDTPSVLSDKAARAASRTKTVARHRKRKHGVVSLTDDLS